ncbi:hypothetical protein BJ684DRAFT_19939 [Piptocephalis cylindrospora]|uniref:Uncharacterized protein n=1 Tax=Piptocephalis cylindrospora TaxID=1907219 RepID=A0A4P9Y4B7_9FUNG|nr:hypothetical protein BJ684DRAFT_19939 [Piptocephalis cylindrospora]|eukprot:RKP13584.1 hypothetical protein BJ684DRAFT_19939 [Piptocephalis cylindrospora]
MQHPTHCPLCSKELRQFHLDLTSKVQLCPDPECIYPLMEPNLSSFLSIPPTKSSSSSRKKSNSHPKKAARTSTRVSPYPKACPSSSSPIASPSCITPYNDPGLSRTPTALLASSASPVRDHHPTAYPPLIQEGSQVHSDGRQQAHFSEVFSTSEDLHQFLFADTGLNI